MYSPESKTLARSEEHVLCLPKFHLMAEDINILDWDLLEISTWEVTHGKKGVLGTWEKCWAHTNIHQHINTYWWTENIKNNEDTYICMWATAIWRVPPRKKQNINKINTSLPARCIFDIEYRYSISHSTWSGSLREGRWLSSYFPVISVCPSCKDQAVPDQALEGRITST